MGGKICGYSWVCCTYTTTMECKGNEKNAVWKEGPVNSTNECVDKCVKPPECTKTCPKTYRPVCASNGKTFPNKCKLENEACDSSEGIVFRNKGYCEDYTKTRMKVKVREKVMEHIFNLVAGV